MHKRSLTPSGFTLVELLVVIGIIGLLVSILLPALAAARRAGQSVACLANLRNLANAEAVYQAITKGIYTISDDDLEDLQKVSISQNKFTYGRVNFCPAAAAYGIHDGLYDGYATGVHNFTSYGWNSWLTFTNSSPLRLKIKPALIHDSSEVVFRADVMPSDATGVIPLTTGGDNSIFDPYRATGTTAPFTAMKPNFQGRHNGLGAVLWMDGHASLERPIAVPDYVPINTGNVSAVQSSPSFYQKYKLGYLAKPGTDFTSISAEYYFVFRKEFLAKENMSIYLDPSKSVWR